MNRYPFTVEIVPTNGFVTLRLFGEVDMESAPSVRDAAICAIRHHSTTLRVDLSGVTFMDSTGLEALIATRRRVELEGGQLQLLAPTRAVMRVLEVTGVDRLFEIETCPEPTVA